tara:strand:+ start:123 stop:560 length:438 start_codon:yes stop_codon:yes gene_type:complete
MKKTKKMINDEIIIYPSNFLPDINVNVVFKESEMYEGLIPLFETYGFGFLAPELNMIILDGEVFLGDNDLTIDDMKMIEAHEVSHIILGHKGGERSDKDELEADLGAYTLLKRKGISTDRLVDIFPERHGIEFEEDLLSMVENRI